MKKKQILVKNFFFEKYKKLFTINVSLLKSKSQNFLNLYNLFTNFPKHSKLSFNLSQTSLRTLLISLISFLNIHFANVTFIVSQPKCVPNVSFYFIQRFTPKVSLFSSCKGKDSLAIT